MLPIKKCCIIICCTSLLLNCNSTRFPKASENNRIVINSGDSIYTIHILNTASSEKIKAVSESFYYYYTFGSIKKTEGGFQGKLLDGDFTVENDSHLLLEQGGFDRGRKNGEWKNWHPTGYLKESIQWKDGRQQGKFYVYTPEGVLIQKGNYRKGKLHGDIISFENGQPKKVSYHDGEVVVPKPKKEKKKKEQEVKSEAVKNAAGAERTQKKERRIPTIEETTPAQGKHSPTPQERKKKKRKEKKSSEDLSEKKDNRNP